MVLAKPTTIDFIWLTIDRSDEMEPGTTRYNLRHRPVAVHKCLGALRNRIGIAFADMLKVVAGFKKTDPNATITNSYVVLQWGWMVTEEKRQIVEKLE